MPIKYEVKTTNSTMKESTSPSSSPPAIKRPRSSSPKVIVPYRPHTPPRPTTSDPSLHLCAPIPAGAPKKIYLSDPIRCQQLAQQWSTLSAEERNVYAMTAELRKARYGEEHQSIEDVMDIFKLHWVPPGDRCNIAPLYFQKDGRPFRKYQHTFPADLLRRDARREDYGGVVDADEMVTEEDDVMTAKSTQVDRGGKAGNQRARAASLELVSWTAMDDTSMQSVRISKCDPGIASTGTSSTIPNGGQENVSRAERPRQLATVAQRDNIKNGREIAHTRPAFDTEIASLRKSTRPKRIPNLGSRSSMNRASLSRRGQETKSMTKAPSHYRTVPHKTTGLLKPIHKSLKHRLASASIQSKALSRPHIVDIMLKPSLERSRTPRHDLSALKQKLRPLIEEQNFEDRQFRLFRQGAMTGANRTKLGQKTRLFNRRMT